MTALEEREPQARQLKRELASVFDVEPFAPFDLHGVTPWKHFSKERLDKGQELALAVGEGVVEFDRSAREDLRKDLPGWVDRGPQWPEYLNALTWLNDRALLDYIKPDWKEPKLSEELIARDVLSIVEKDQESHGSKKIRDHLRDMNPPLTWGEVVYHFLSETTKGESGALREFLSLFRKRYCLECDELFTAPKSSRLTCRRCLNRLNKRKERLMRMIIKIAWQAAEKRGYAIYADYNEHMKQLICEGRLEPVNGGRYQFTIKERLVADGWEHIPSGPHDPARFYPPSKNHQRLALLR